MCVCVCLLVRLIVCLYALSYPALPCLAFCLLACLLAFCYDAAQPAQGRNSARQRLLAVHEGRAERLEGSSHFITCICQQGSSHYTPEHGLVNGGFPVFWRKTPCFKWLQHVSVKEPWSSGDVQVKNASAEQCAAIAGARSAVTTAGPLLASCNWSR